MESWHWTALLLCCFGFLKEFRPSEQFITEFLIDSKNITKEQVVQIAYPISTYTYLGVLPIVFLLTDFLRYRIVILIEGAGFVVVYAMLIWGEGLTNLKILEVFYGTASACEVAYYTYIYAKVDKEHYKLVTSYTYSAIFIGNLTAAIASQFLVSYELMNYLQLNYLSLGGTGLAFILAIFLPSVQQSIYFHPNNENSSSIKRTTSNPGFHTRVGRAYYALFRDFTNAYSNSYILKWSIWWALAAAVHLQVSNYSQALWKVVHPSGEERDRWNGAVGASQSLLSAVIAIGVAKLKVPWEKWGEAYLSVISIVQGLCLFWMAETNNIFVCYVMYIIFRIFYQVLITVASAEIATRISDDSYGLIFGINTFGAVLIQTIITLTVTDKEGFALNERNQFRVYSGYHGILGIIFIIAAVITLFLKRKSYEPYSQPIQNSKVDNALENDIS